jgi:hypothetical protein
MFKRANKVTALLVAAASVMSVVPAMAADSTRLGTKDGTIENAVAFEGKYIYEGYKGDSDKAVYFNDGSKDKELTDYEDYDFTAARYGEKYIIAEDGNDHYLVDLTNGSITEDTLEDKLDSTASKLEKALKKTDKYDGITVDADLDLTLLKSSAKFQNPWYSVVKTDANGKSNTIFTSEDGKYVDSSVIANIYAYSSEKGKIVKVEKFGKEYSDTKLEVNLHAGTQPKVIAQDKDNLYAIVNVDIADTSSKLKSAATYETYEVTTAAGAVAINGGLSTASINEIYGQATDAFSTKYNVTKNANSVTIKAKTAGVIAAADDISTKISGSFKTVTGAATSTASVSVPTNAWYLQKISKSQGDTDEEAYEPKDVTSYQIDNKSLYDNGDVNDAYGWLISGGDVANFINVEVKDNSLYAYKLDDSDTVKVFKLDLKQIKENPVDKTVFGETKLDGYVVKKDGDSDQDFDAYSLDSNGIVWILNDGKIIKFAEKDKTTVYTVDSGLDSLNVYDEKNLIAWNYDDERYTTVTEGTEVTQGEATVVAPAVVTGWVQAADATWTFNDATGTKIANKWINVGGAWYYLKADGVMATGWYNDNGTWYFLKASGAMATGWYNDNGTWYYLNASGAMLANTTVDGYVLGASGAWIK